MNYEEVYNYFDKFSFKVGQECDDEGYINLTKINKIKNEMLKELKKESEVGE